MVQLFLPVTANCNMAATPTDIGKYQVERELGRGTSGAVYLARDTFRNNWVAIKQSTRT